MSQPPLTHPETADLVADSAGWYPIHTAPLDGTQIDLWVADSHGRGRRMVDCYFYVSGDRGAWLDSSGSRIEETRYLDHMPPYVEGMNNQLWPRPMEIRVTYWRSIPGPPEEQGSD